MVKPKSSQANKMFLLLRKEIILYEGTYILNPNLQMLLDALLIIKPTSIKK